jgi:hypothetical protein
MRNRRSRSRGAASGELCRVAQITDEGDVVFVSLTVDGPRPEIERMEWPTLSSAKSRSR